MWHHPFLVEFEVHANKLILWEASLNSDGQQFHQYQQNAQSPLALTQWTHIKPWPMTLEIQVLAWDRHKHVAGLNRLMGLQCSPFDNWISSGHTYISKWWKTYTDSFPLTKTTHYHKMNDNINMDNTISGSVNAGS